MWFEKGEMGFWGRRRFERFDFLFGLKKKIEGVKKKKRGLVERLVMVMVGMRSVHERAVGLLARA